MASAVRLESRPATLADLLHDIGDVSPRRIPVRPYPGTATVKDVIRALEAPEKRLYELVDGVLVEKDIGLKESVYATRIIARMEPFASRHGLGFTAGADGALEIMPHLVRIPDVSFISWDDVEGDDIPEEPVPNLVPRLAVEVISQGDTPGEMARKLRDYFAAGVQLVWLVYPKTQTAEAYTSPKDCQRIEKNQALDGGSVLPGFKLPVKELFQRGPKRRRGR